MHVSVLFAPRVTHSPAGSGRSSCTHYVVLSVLGWSQRLRGLRTGSNNAGILAPVFCFDKPLSRDV